MPFLGINSVAYIYIKRSNYCVIYCIMVLIVNFEVAFIFKLFGKEKNGIYCAWTPLFSAFTTQGEKKELGVAFLANCVTAQ